MDLQAESFVGVWDVYSGSMHCELMLMPDNAYRSTLWGGVQMHWGTWSLREVQGHPVLHFELTGAQPTVQVGPFGPIPINWPSAESWVITEVQGNLVAVYGGVMLRRPTLASISQEVPAQMPEIAPTSVPAQFMPGAQGAPNPTPEASPLATVPNQGSSIPPPVPAQFAPAPPPPAPDPHWAEINRQWQDLHTQMIKSAQEATFKRSEVVHQGNQRFLDYLKS